MQSYVAKTLRQVIMSNRTKSLRFKPQIIRTVMHAPWSRTYNGGCRSINHGV
jgi:hypothetical protein